MAITTSAHEAAPCTQADGFASYMGCITDNIQSTREAVSELFRACTVLWMKSTLAHMKADPEAEAAWNEAREAFANANEYLAYVESDLGDSVLREHARRTEDEADDGLEAAPHSNAAEE